MISVLQKETGFTPKVSISRSSCKRTCSMKAASPCSDARLWVKVLPVISTQPVAISSLKLSMTSGQ